MEAKANERCRIMVVIAIALFFGVSLWMVLPENVDDRALLVFDIVSVRLMILIVFWLIVVEEVSKQREQEP